MDEGVRVESEASVCLSGFRRKGVQLDGGKPSAEETQVLMNLSRSLLSVTAPCVINIKPSRTHQWLLLATSLLSDLIAQSSAFKGKPPLTSDIKGAHQRACDQGGAAEGGTTFGSALIPF